MLNYSENKIYLKSDFNLFQQKTSNVSQVLDGERIAIRVLVPVPVSADVQE